MVHGIAARDASLGYGGTMADRYGRIMPVSACTCPMSNCKVM
jgi:hypothetical protein